jgi:type VI secretion system secreted protein VgrG
MANSLSMFLQTTSGSLEHGEVTGFRGREAISQLFEFEIDMHFPDPNAPPLEDLRGELASLVLRRADSTERVLHGMIRRASERFDISDESCHLTLSFVPRAHELTLVKTQDVFIDKSVNDLISEKCQMHGLASVDYQILSENPPPKDFVVQFDETDLAFLSRLTEHHGISYCFEHGDGDGDGRDKLIFCDSRTFPRGNIGTLRLVGRQDDGGMKTLRRSVEVMPATYVVMDYDYEHPDVELTRMCSRDEGYTGGVFEYGNHYRTEQEGDLLAEIRAAESLARHVFYRGTSDVMDLTAGHVFEIEKRGRIPDDQLLIVAVDHEIIESEAHGGIEYRNEFLAVAADSGFCPPRRTPKPKIAGVMTGVVEPSQLGVVEDAAKLDGAGRYHVKLHFDTTPLGEQPGSKPIRSIRVTAGPNFGVHFPLRPGMEVMLAFVNGDPDRPVIVGAAHAKSTVDPLRDSSAQHNMIRTQSGITMVFKDLG